MSEHVVGFGEVGGTQVAQVGGKGAGLAALAALDGVDVPAGFCVTTDAYRHAVGPAVAGAVRELAGLAADDRAGIAERSAAVRQAIEAVELPGDLVAAISEAVDRLGAGQPLAVRSSATAEDLPTASFAGQHDSHLDVVGVAAVLDHVRRCWASLFTDRAVAYRLRAGIDHAAVAMAVVVQRLVPAEVAGVLFTADPTTGNRTVSRIEAVVGLGEALVSGLVTPDAYEVRGGEVRARSVAPERADRPTLTDDELRELEQLGRRIEAGLGSPQDIEWCLVDGRVSVVQSRPITTLFPLPASAADGAVHVYVSVGHQQMMTDAMKPLGLSVWQRYAGPPMHEAGGRLFVDVAAALASPATRDALIEGFGATDPLTTDALRAVVARDGFLPAHADPDAPRFAGPPAPTEVPIAADPTLVADIVARADASIAASAHVLDGLSGAALFDALRTDIVELKRVLTDPLGRQVIYAGMDAAAWLNDHLLEWLGERNVADTLSRSMPNNVTSEMGLALLDVADVVRRHPEAVALLEQADDDGFLAELTTVAGGDEVHDVLTAFLDEYGMRCVGEIDLTRPRWHEHPTALLPAILANVRGVEPGEAERRFDQGEQAAAAKARDVLARLRALPDGDAKAAETEAVIDRLRTFVGYREFPKFAIVQRAAHHRRALLAEADRLVRAGVLRQVEDASFLRLEELEEAATTGVADLDLIDERRERFRAFEGLTPPRVLTFEGESVASAYQRDDVPEGALVGLAVSAGTVEGRARVVHDIGDADLEPGDILVTAFTDPSWSPLFVAVAGLVTEVGGLLSHGSVVAREYGLPAVVAVEGATRRIRDGQRIRLHAAEGYVELL